MKEVRLTPAMASIEIRMGCSVKTTREATPSSIFASEMLANLA